MTRRCARAAISLLVAGVAACGLGVDFDRYARESGAANDGGVSDVAARDAGADATTDGGNFCSQRPDAAFCTDFTDESGWTRTFTTRCDSTCLLELVPAPVVSPPRALHARVATDGAGYFFELDHAKPSHHARVEFSFRADEVGAAGVVDVMGLSIGPSLSEPMGELRAYLNAGGTLSVEEDSYEPDGAPAYGNLPAFSRTVDVRGRFVRVAMELVIDDAGGGSCSFTLDGEEMVPSCRLSERVRPGLVRLKTGFVFAQKSNAPWSAFYDDVVLYAD